MNYEIHDDGSVTSECERVGTLVTGEDGLAYIEFFDSHAPPTGQHWFVAATYDHPCKYLNP